ncbi:MFS transporter [Haliea sp. E1-2-M8]|uniref:MFS transporter n=1 Tax=Haliea sp. E1-2-M8 TaxID=3064706 RepID=UPI00271BAEF5|nr:MFS transporter [Haliea sp. E1-2-M8]MDO8864018.1 MFS transporter [Haliea sp. E1-2-M8]
MKKVTSSGMRHRNSASPIWQRISVMTRGFRFWSTVMVVICFVLGVVVYGGGRYSFGIFMRPLSESMGWTRTQISLAVTINLICYGISSPIVGWLLDTIGARKVMITGATLMTVSLCGMYFVNSLWMFYFLFGVVSAFGANGIGRIASASIMANWFVRRRGLMMGVTALSIGLGTAIMAPLVRLFLDLFGWRLAFLAIGVMLAVLVLLPIVLLVKGQGRPEDRGFSPDDASFVSAPPYNVSATGVMDAGDWRMREALGSVTFWGISLAIGISYMADYLVLLHGPADFEDRGYSGATAAMVLSMASLTSCIGRLGFGWLADNANQQLTLVLMFAVQAIATPLIIIDGGLTALYAFAFIWGIGYGGAASLAPAVIADYFGRYNFSSIYGWTTMVAVFFGAAGGVIGGLIYDSLGNYLWAWGLCGLLWLLAVGIVLLFGGKPIARKV